ncbi:phage tail tape measure protein [Pannonibacter tanglangensis]|uniref:Phage tail tape measure protein n=1 Tax=Pannonibacter tanglangensis TaxID=2750084 RepID=A0ABW9ZI20_9HYPH|nr:phage tail tape measure protein [Pannonibacter sp. XCT-34]NBN62774.1 phage tail tape measure protein [Pannonibacter sp. XCT-34]
MAILSSTLRLSLVDGVTRRAGPLVGAMNRVDRAAHSLQRTAMIPVGSGMLGNIIALGGAYIGVQQSFSATVGSAMRFESAMADVTKVVSGTPEQLDNMRRQILQLSTAMPLTAEGFASIYAAAAQSGLALGELKTFAEMTAQVSTAWDMAAGETGQALAEIKSALKRDVEGVRQMADAINHLSNISAASAPRLLGYQQRVAAFAEIAGYSAEQAAAFGAAMIGAGNEPEVAATSFRNMTRALTAGSNATKTQRVALKKLGLDSVAVAKRMQKDAVGQTLDVIDRIGKLPEWQQISIASQLFGDEARALAPLFGNTAELRRLLGEVADKTKYAGSAMAEYEQRLNTLDNTWQLTKNKLWTIGEDIGASILPALKETLLGVNDILDTLGSRATIFDKIGTSFSGFMDGLGDAAPVRETVNAIGDLLLGAANGGDAATTLGRIYQSSKQWGEWFAGLGQSIGKTVQSLEKLIGLDAGGLGDLLGSVAGYGVTLAAASVGFGLLAGAITRLGSAILFLSGLKAAASSLKWLAGLAGLGGGAAAAGGTAATAATGAAAAGGGAGLLAGAKRFGGRLFGGLRMAKWLRGASGAGLALLGVQLAIENAPTQQETFAGNNWTGTAIQDAINARMMGFGGTTDNMPGKMKDDLGVGLKGGVQDVRITNPAPAPNVQVSVSVQHTSTMDPEAVGRRIGEAVASEVRGVYSDAGGGGW